MINTNGCLTCNQTNKLCVHSPFVTQINSSGCAVRQCVIFFLMGKVCVTRVSSLSRECRSAFISFHKTGTGTCFKPEDHSIKRKVTPDTDGIPTLLSQNLCVTKSDSSRYLAGLNYWHAETKPYFFQSAFFFSAHPHLAITTMDTDWAKKLFYGSEKGCDVCPYSVSPYSLRHLHQVHGTP